MPGKLQHSEKQVLRAAFFCLKKKLKNKMEATGIKKLVGSILQAEKKKKSGEICLRPYVF